MAQDRSYPFRATGAGIVTGALGVGVLQLPLEHAGSVGASLIAGGALVIGAPTWRWLHQRGTSQRVIGKWSESSRRHDGMASPRDFRRVASRRAVRRMAPIMRPSLAERSWWERYRTPPTEYATLLALVGRREMWSPCEFVTMRVGGPRTGKTAELAVRIIEAPGAVIATSTRTDLYQWTVATRAKKGPIHLFNPSNLGGLATTIKWSPLVGCRIPAIAQRRADDMIPPSTSSEGERWDTQARRVLKLLMHAAALQGLGMRAVLSWVANPTPEAANAVNTALQRSPEAVAMQLDARQFFTTNERTRSSITATLMPVLSWLSDSHAAAVGDAAVDEDLLDVPSLLRERGTLYLLGAEDKMTAPVIAALTAEIAHQARLMASGMPSQRLDPPLTMALDEAALICPVPLERWTADMGGYGITIHISIQSRAQLRARWGHDNAAAILNNCGVIMIFNAKDDEDARSWSSIIGDREEVTETTDKNGKVTGRATRLVAILPPSALVHMPKGYAAILFNGMPPCVGQPVNIWKRKDVIRTNKRTPYVPEVRTSYEDDVRAEQSGGREGTTK
jgi:type IV secretion system protein VirD4